MTNAELEKARVRLYEKSDRKPAIMATGGALMALFGFIAFLNLIGSVNLALRPGQQPIERFLFWLVFAIMGFIGPYGFFLAKRQREIKQVERRPRLPSRRRGGGAVRHDPRGRDRGLEQRPVR